MRPHFNSIFDLQINNSDTFVISRKVTSLHKVIKYVKRSKSSYHEFQRKTYAKCYFKCDLFSLTGCFFITQAEIDHHSCTYNYKNLCQTMHGFKVVIIVCYSGRLVGGGGGSKGKVASPITPPLSGSADAYHCVSYSYYIVIFKLT